MVVVNYSEYSSKHQRCHQSNHQIPIVHRFCCHHSKWQGLPVALPRAHSQRPFFLTQICLDPQQKYPCLLSQNDKRKVVPGIELGLPESESDVLTITLYNRLMEGMFEMNVYIRCITHAHRVAHITSTFASSRLHVLCLRKEFLTNILSSRSALASLHTM